MMIFSKNDTTSKNDVIQERDTIFKNVDIYENGYIYEFDNFLKNDTIMNVSESRHENSFAHDYVVFFKIK
jgi:hypothetical protein